MKLEKKYKEDIVPKMMEEFDYDNEMAVPEIKKVVLNVGINKEKKQASSDYVEKVMEILAEITGQYPRKTKAKKSVSGFNIKEGETVGVSAILREEKMYSFLEKLFFVALPRTRDFRGLDSRSVDSNGNLSIGLRNEMCFPEVDSEETETAFGLQITIVTSANKQEHGLRLLDLMEVPFSKR